MGNDCKVGVANMVVIIDDVDDIIRLGVGHTTIYEYALGASVHDVAQVGK